MTPRWTLPKLLAASRGELVRWGTGPFERISTDSREVAAGDVFVALRGPRFDGHEFVSAALERGATAALVEHGDSPGAAACIRVGDGARALGDLAASWRRRCRVRVVGVTGSNGKTTTKEMIAAVLGAAGRPVAKSRGTENNLVGLPHTLLRLTGEEAFAVVEMGMNHPGEIWRLAEIARPEVGVITNIGPAHLEGLGSLANVAAAKEELALALPSSATLVIHAPDPRLQQIARRFTGRVIAAGAEGLRALSVAPTGDGQRMEIEAAGTTATVDLAVRGAHNVNNAMLAIGVGVAFELPLDVILAGLAAFTPPPMRLEAVRLASGARLLNDAYNANPASMCAALSALAAESGGRRIAVLGEMWELGAETARYHREVGAAAREAGIDVLLAVGAQADAYRDGAIAAGMPAQSVERFATAAAAGAWLAERLAGDDVVLIKGSRGAKMEQVLQHLEPREQAR
jgi:UDP-N-acetylmuramoyl-tripeptide--D-alanyl-D-alanine ligase